MTTNFEQWYTRVKEACQHHDSDIAYSALIKWDEMITQAPVSVRDEVMKLKEKLLFTAFPSLPSNQAASIIEKQLLHLLVSEVDADEIIRNRFLYIDYGSKEVDRRALHEAILRNKQKLGEKTVGEWLQTFDHSFPPEERDEAAARTFFTRIPSIGSMSRTEQNLLQIILRLYDQWFALPLTTVYDAAVVYQKINELERAGVKEINPRTFEAQYLSPSRGSQNSVSQAGSQPGTGSQKIVSLPLLQALSKYEQIGNQLITAERIRVKSQPDPVRPSLLYWLKYYRDELGVGHHDSVQRGQFLFRSENGKHLSTEERERVNLILRSVEENYPLQIDTANGEIIFPTVSRIFRDPAKGGGENNSPVRPVYQEPVVVPKSPVFVAPLPTPPAPPREAREVRIERKEERKETPAAPRPSFQVGRGMNFGNVQPTTLPEKGTLSFTSSHVFPAEKEREVVAQAQAPAPASKPAPRAQQRQSSPFHIYPVSLGEEAGEEDNR